MAGPQLDIFQQTDSLQITLHWRGIVPVSSSLLFYGSVENFGFTAVISHVDQAGKLVDLGKHDFGTGAANAYVAFMSDADPLAGGYVLFRPGAQPRQSTVAGRVYGNTFALDYIQPLKQLWLLFCCAGRDRVAVLRPGLDTPRECRLGRQLAEPPSLDRPEITYRRRSAFPKSSFLCREGISFSTVETEPFRCCTTTAVLQ